MILPSIVISKEDLPAVPLPILISCVLGYGPTGGGSEVVLRGAYLSDATSVRIGGIECSFLADDDTQITAETEAHAAGAVNIEITTPSGTCTLLSGFVFQGPPDLSAAILSVTSGPHDEATFITVTNCLRIMAGATLTLRGDACLINRLGPTSFTFYAPGCLEAQIGLADLVLTNPDGQSDTLNDAFEYTSPADLIKAISVIGSVNSVAFGPTTGSTALLIRGVGFVHATGVTVGGVAATSFVIVDDFNITCVTPAGTAGAKDVVVLSPMGDTTLSAAWTYVAAPSLASATLSLTSGSYKGGDEITVTNAENITFGTTMTLGAVAQTIKILSNTSFSFVLKEVAVASIGAKDLVVTDLYARSATKAGAYTITSKQVPTFTSMTALAAEISVVGMVGDLVGATTGNRILRAKRDVAGANGLSIEGMIDFTQVSTTLSEFDGVFAPVLLSTSTGSKVCGTPGSDSTGGLICGAGGFDGALQFQGFRKIAGHIRMMWAEVRLDVLGTFTNLRYIGVGLGPTNAVGDCYAGGMGDNGTAWRSGAILNATPVGAGHSGSTTTAAVVAGSATTKFTMMLNKTSTTADAAGYAMGLIQGNVSSGLISSNNTASLDSSLTTNEPIIFARIISTTLSVRLLRLCIVPHFSNT